MKKLALFSLLLVVCTAFAGCGGSDGARSSSPRARERMRLREEQLRREIAKMEAEAGVSDSSPKSTSSGTPQIEPAETAGNTSVLENLDLKGPLPSAVDTNASSIDPTQFKFQTGGGPTRSITGKSGGQATIADLGKQPRQGTIKVQPPQLTQKTRSLPQAMTAEEPKMARMMVAGSTEESADAMPEVERAGSEDSSGPGDLIESKEPADEEYATVEVFYATDRKGQNPQVARLGEYAGDFAVAGLALLATIFVCGLFNWLKWPRLRTITLVLGICATLGLSYFGLKDAKERWELATAEGRVYRGERGPVELGVCEVTIPPNHDKGVMESPSLLRLEVFTDVEKHVVFHKATTLEKADFYEEMRSRVKNSPREDAFVFVHGFNVSFQDAARRTAQIAYDLEFEGAPIFYSWPSQAGLLSYTVDKENAIWASEDLKNFLLEVADQSGAKHINLIAHSMGNRALGEALNRLSREIKAETPKQIFHEIVLTAPDIDAEVFRRDIAPNIIPLAKRVTLYASSNDDALALSKKINGFPRAGDSGEGLVVIPGIDTVDVSAIDTSFLGHSYFGDNVSVITDLVHLIKDAKPPQLRRSALHSLQPMIREGLVYWVFHKRVLSAEREGSKR